MAQAVSSWRELSWSLRSTELTAWAMGRRLL